VVQDFTDIKEMDKNKLELVSPAGNWDQLEAAVNAGADAVYLAYEKYGARAYAENFNLENLQKAVYFAHSNNVKVYLALNTLIKEKELNDFIEFIFNALKNINFDAVIVQDFAAAKIINEIYPKISIHASTQLNIHNSLSLQFLKEYGFKRTITAREVTLEELKEMTAKKIMEIEIFGHGSQCYSYSGQCYFSSFVGERSGNRGTCPQPCRMKYELVREYKQESNNFSNNASKNEELIGKYYFLSKSDLITVFYLPEIIKAGINALKIEGRMKTPEYVGIVTKIYRKYIDLFYEYPEKFIPDKVDIYKLKQIFSREINEGYLNKKFPDNIVSLKKSGNIGSYFGRVLRIESEDFSKKNYKNIYINSEINLNKNDILEIWTKKGNERITVNDYEIISENNNEKKFYKIKISKNIDLNINDRVFKYFDYSLDKEAKSLYLFKINNFKEDNIIKNEFNIENYYKLKSLLNKNKDLYKNTNSLKNEKIFNKKINVNNEIINDFNSFNKILSISLFFYNKNKNSESIIKNIVEIINVKNEKYNDKFLNINFLYEDSYNLFIKNDEEDLNKVVNIFEKIKIKNVNFYIVTPNIAYDEQLNNLEKILLKLINNGIKNFYVSNPGILFLLNKISNSLKLSLNIILGYNFNLFNSFAISEIKKHLNLNIKITGIIVSAELTLLEINDITLNLKNNTDLKNFLITTDFFIYSYGFFPIMTSRVRYKELNNNFNDFSDYILKDLKNFKFKISHDYLNNIQLFNAKKHCVIFDLIEIINNNINGFLIDLRFLEEEEIYFIFKSFIDGLMLVKNINTLEFNGKKSNQDLFKKYKIMLDNLKKSPFLTNYTKGHLYREVL